MPLEVGSAALAETQRIRAELRENFLRSLENLNGSPAIIRMHEKTTVSGVFLRANPQLDHIIVENLQTPIGKLDCAVLRTQDILSLEFEIEEK